MESSREKARVCLKDLQTVLGDSLVLAGLFVEEGLKGLLVDGNATAKMPTLVCSTVCNDPSRLLVDSLLRTCSKSPRSFLKEDDMDVGKGKLVEHRLSERLLAKSLGIEGGGSDGEGLGIDGRGRTSASTFCRVLCRNELLHKSLSRKAKTMPMNIFVHGP